ncbi:MAG: A24 family peptidase [Alphaproteobacteria bacterium]|nr:A24 family peptidase [Alphaproteobacteria bacterium]
MPNDYISIAALTALVLYALYLLCRLIAIDLKHFLLPNKYVFPFGLCGLAFHTIAFKSLAHWPDLIIAAFLGGALLYIVRHFANNYYKEDTLGLGDVKLIAASGLWLGTEFVFLAISLGAFAGVLHGLAIALHRKSKGESVKLGHLSLPAGPGFIIGILIAAILRFHTIAGLLLL